MPSFIKTTLIICFLSVFYVSCAIAMDDEDKNHLHVTHKIELQNDQSSPIKEEEKCCSHWGLSRWLYGIKEYRDRCLLDRKDFERRDPERAYIVRQSSKPDEIMESSDCCYCACLHANSETCCVRCAGICCVVCLMGSDSCIECCIPTLCCPFATITHILCLPFQCCYCAPNQTFLSYYSEPKSVTSKTKDAQREKVSNMTPEEQESYFKTQKTINDTNYQVNNLRYQNINYWNNIYHK